MLPYSVLTIRLQILPIQATLQL